MGKMQEKEKNLLFLEKQIEGLKELATNAELNFDQEIADLEEKAKQMKEDLYKGLDTWDKVALARHMERPTTMEYIEMIFEDFLEFHGDRQFADDPAIVGGIASFEGTPVTVIGHQKGKNTKENIYRRFGMPKPEGYRKALRLMQQANKFNRPIVTFINSAGAYPDKEAEERGQSEAIARNLREMAGFGVPVVAIVIGEGGSGGALALGVANKVYMLENTYYSVISPEGAATILWNDPTKAKEAAETLKITASDLHELGVIDDVIAEPEGGSHTQKEKQAEDIRQVLRTALDELSAMTKEELIEQRFEKFRLIGQFSEVAQSE